MALESLQEEQESEEVESISDEVDEIAETVVRAVVGEQMLEEKETEPMLEPFADPWDASVRENECDCAMMAAAKILKDEVQFEKTFKELKNKLFVKENKISNLKHEHSITKDQLQTMVEKYKVCKMELESTQIICENWVESCKGYELMLEKQIKSNVKFGIGFRKHYQTKNTAEIDSGLAKVIPTNMAGQEIKVTDKNGNKIILEKPKGSLTFEEIEKYQFKPVNPNINPDHSGWLF
ncbi:hypothetical protein Hanom_Chr06g00531941 [Helianthus anomalus]